MQKYCHITNKINYPSYLIISSKYNDFVDIDSGITIDGVLEYHPDLFNRVFECEDIKEASDIFIRYMEELFHLKEKIKGKYVNSYIKVLRGWLFDSNRSEGAVIKGWVESRFGIIPSFHKSVIKDAESVEYRIYLMERMGSNSSKNLIEHQFDLLYTFTQHAIRRFYKSFIPYVTLYRGFNNLDEFNILDTNGKEKYILLNNVSSFSISKDIAGTFGDYVLEVKVPFTKIIFFQDVLPTLRFSGEMEIMVVGGVFRGFISYF